jgi:SnoaL-like domain
MTRQDQVPDRWAIRELIEGWVVWRDGGNWEQLRACWHDDGRMMATWFQGTADEFIQVCRTASASECAGGTCWAAWR